LYIQPGFVEAFFSHLFIPAGSSARPLPFLRSIGLSAAARYTFVTATA
jgi:hypothetical protein